jgi:diguanylate cyclase (GGDEF)-like protein
VGPAKKQCIVSASLYHAAAVLRFVSRSIGRRIGAIVGIATAIFGIGGLLLVLQQTFRTQETITRRLLQTLAHSVATSFKSFDTRTGQHPVGDISAELTERPEIEGLDVFDRHGRIRWSSDVRRRGKMAEAELLAVLTSTPTARAPKRTADDDEVQVVVPLRKTSSCLPCHEKGPDPIGGLAVTASNRKLLASVVEFTERMGITVVISLALLTALLLYLIDRVVVSRLRHLVAVMTKAEEGDFLVRASVSSHDEIGLLASTFNKMLAKITDLRVERIESEREMDQVKDELSLKAELAQKSEQLEAANASLQARLKQLSFLNQLGRDLASRLDIEYLIDLLTGRLSESFNVPAVSVLLFERSSSQLRVGGKPFDPAHPGADAVRNKEAMLVDGSFHVPLIYQDNPIGLLTIAARPEDPIGEEERHLFVTVASQASLALANAQLFQETLELSLKDGLTGILNRRALESRIELEWSRALRDQAPMSIVMVDIDHFKVYNDQHGHQLGDETLRRVARIIERNIRKVDAVARYGGEEFAIILPRAGKKEAIEVAKKLRRSVEQADFVRGYLQPLGRVTISCGVSTGPEDATSVEDLIHRADEALFSAKEAGRNTVRAHGEVAVESGPTSIGSE